ncbi:hypothetical protein NM208_g7792 [Fusarium decemcellulare]|uniref:Uncharacterized protein n=1 Tax=Fusarium decemcellulare TaxID=57161 RepID=A0ACC1S7T6_9HYPO|nr:hypothetical protein NM208_g7792 [Fusarium decemcellulare]
MKTQQLYGSLQSISRRFLSSRRKVRQDIGVNNVNPAKLARKLSSTFEQDDFEVDLIHNTYIIRASRKLSASHFDRGIRSFSPEGSLDELITRNSILRAFYEQGRKPPEITPAHVERTVDFILDRAKKLFAISILTGFKHEKLRQVMSLFESNSISDRKLPLEKSHLRDLGPPFFDPGEDDGHGSEDSSDFGATGKRALSHGNDDDDDYDGSDDDSDEEDTEDEESLWEESDISHFCDTHQWEICAPVFFANKDNHDLDPQAILPFIAKHEDSTDSGSFGQVIKYSIHNCHLKADELEIPNTEFVAVKHIKLDEGQNRTTKIRGWEKEVRALWQMKELNQKHIVKFITAFRRGEEDHCLMLEWANGGNLKNLWENFRRPLLTGSLVKATFEQLHGLAQALYRAHYPESPAVDGFYRHGDLKPENILWFKDEHGERGEMGTLKICDWGLAKNHPIITELRTKPTTTGYGTRRYEAPEESTSNNSSLMVQDRSGKDVKKRSRLYDIWAMGCIALEFLIWLMYGPAELDRFNRQVRGKLDENLPLYEVNKKGEAKVHRVAEKWMKHMAKDPACEVGQTALGNLLELIRDQLLVVKLPTGLGSQVDMSAMPNNTRSLPLSQNITLEIDSPSSPPSTTNVPAVTLTEAPLTDASAKTGALIDSELKLPRSARGGRVRAKDFFDRMEVISGDDESERYWLAGAPLPPPDRDDDDPAIDAQGGNRHHTEDSKRGLGRKRPEESLGGQFLGVRNAQVAPTELKDYGQTNLDHTWTYTIDNDYAKRTLSLTTSQYTSALPVSQSSRLCSTCQALRDGLWTPDFSITYESSLPNADTCDLCRLLLSVCKGRHITKTDRVRFGRDGSTLIVNGYGPPVASILRSPNLRTGIDQQVQVGLPFLQAADSEPYLEIIKYWLENCDRSHPNCTRDSGGSNSGSLGPTKRLPTRVIAVGHKGDGKVYLREPGPNDRGEWIALSHQWGTGPKFCTTRSNLDDHLKGIAMDNLPDTFRDAVIVARALGCSYLWIDSICIIQGRDGDFGKEAKRMEQVYSQAYCVLAASRSPGHDAGFLQAREHRESVSLQRDGDSAPFYICAFIDDFDEHVLQGSLNQRGWVLQEHALARRTVYFTNHQTYFECGEGVHCETMTRMQNQVAAFLGDPQFPQLLMKKADKGAKILGYQGICKHYCQLGLSHDTDRPWAIKGLQERFLRTLKFDGKIDGGFGVFCEDQANGRRRGWLRRGLLWRRAEDVEALSRIDFSSGRVNTKIPSWSWMAFTGGIDFISAEFGGTEWEPVQTQWDAGPTRTSEGVLGAMAKDYKADGQGVTIFFDCPNASDQSASKCVVLGKEKNMISDGHKMHYVLLVQPKPASSEGVHLVYERVGAGILPGKCITGNELKIEIH